MEIVFSDNPISCAVDYIKSNYPYCDIGAIGELGELEYLLNKCGNRVINIALEECESARFIVAFGQDEEIDLAKSKGLPYMVISDGVPLSAFHSFGIYNYQKVEYGYPNIVIFDNSKNEYLFQAEARILLLSLYLECLSVLGSGLRGKKQGVSENLLKELRPMLCEFRTIEEILALCNKCIRALGGLEYVAFLNKVLDLYHPENLLHARFYALFSLLYLERRFTNIDFWVILPYMDEVRVRMLAETNGIKPPLSARRKVELSYLLALVEGYIPTEEELDFCLNGFRLEAGVERVDLSAILSAIILSAELCPKKELVRDIVESGYLDALIS